MVLSVVRNADRSGATRRRSSATSLLFVVGARYVGEILEMVGQSFLPLSLDLCKDWCVRLRSADYAHPIYLRLYYHRPPPPRPRLRREQLPRAAQIAAARLLLRLCGRGAGACE